MVDEYSRECLFLVSECGYTYDHKGYLWLEYLQNLEQNVHNVWVGRDVEGSGTHVSLLNPALYPVVVVYYI